MSSQPVPEAASFRGALDAWGAMWEIPQLADRVRIRWSSRMRTSPGRCRPTTGEITLNQRLLLQHPEQVIPTLCHEAAHVAAYLRCGPAARGHGPEWQFLMELAGFPPRGRCPIDPGAAAPPRGPRTPVRFIHRCLGCGFAARAQREEPSMDCPTCLGPLDVVTLHLV